MVPARNSDAKASTTSIVTVETVIEIERPGQALLFEVYIPCNKWIYLYENKIKFLKNINNIRKRRE